jgi:hypothetical protein
VLSQNGTMGYFRGKRSSIRIDRSGCQGVFCLLWGEPGVRWFWGVLVFFGGGIEPHPFKAGCDRDDAGSAESGECVY